MYFSGVIMGRVLSVGMLVKCVCSAVRPCVCFFFFPSLNFRSREWFCIKKFPPWWPKLDFLFLPPQKCSASPGWEDNSPPGACHVDRAAQLQCPQDMFFFFCLSPRDIPLCLFHAYHHVCSWRYRLRLNPNLSQGWYYSLSFSSRFSYSSLHPFYSSPERSSSKTVFLSCKQNIDKKGMVAHDRYLSHSYTSSCALCFLAFCLQVSL